LHCHILPGIDDGPATMHESLDLAAQIAGAGVCTVVATPHVRPDHPDVVPHELADRCADLRRELEAAGIDLEVLPGGELDLMRALAADDETLRLTSLGQRGSLLLLETPYGPLSSLFEEQIFSLQLRGYALLLAHPERNVSFQKDRRRLGQLVRRGVMTQVTAESLVRSPRGSRSARLARDLVEHGQATVIASDLHGPAVYRTSLSDGVEAARELVGARADWMSADAPRAILAGEVLPPAPRRTRSRGVMQRLLGR
jgi:protein-tyrosine phosphatase